MPSARIRDAAGAGPGRILLDGFVQPVGAHVSEPDASGRIPIVNALVQAADIFRQGASVGVDLTAVAPGGDLAWEGPRARGAAMVFRMLETLNLTIRGADGARDPVTAMLRVDHPDILSFLDVPVFGGASRCVAVTGAFMKALHEDRTIEFAYDQDASGPGTGRPARGRGGRIPTIRAEELWYRMLGVAWKRELGLVFIENGRERNSLHDCDEPQAFAHPEGPLLPAYGSIARGTLMLPSFLTRAGAGARTFDWDAFGAAAAGAVEFLDRVLDITACPLPQHQVEVNNKRRIGLGCSGWGETISALGLRPASGAREFIEAVMTRLRNDAFTASVDLARAHGAFPLFDADRYLRPGSFASTLDLSLQEKIRQHGLRNSHLLTGAIEAYGHERAMTPDLRLLALEAAASRVDGGMALPLQISRFQFASVPMAIVQRALRVGAQSVLLGRRPAPDLHLADRFKQEVARALH